MPSEEVGAKNYGGHSLNGGGNNENLENFGQLSRQNTNFGLIFDKNCGHGFS